MEKRFLVVVDMQNDFITGSLANEKAAKILPRVADLIKNFDGDVVFTRDTHDENYYLDTQEGKNLPIKHCIKDTYGHQIHRELLGWRDARVIDKTTFGSIKLVDYIENFTGYNNLSEIHICGTCTNICVVTNALILKSYFPETKIIVYKNCCAGTSLESHNAALEVMRDCHIEIVD